MDKTLQKQLISNSKKLTEIMEWFKDNGDTFSDEILNDSKVLTKTGRKDLFKTFEQTFVKLCDIEYKRKSCAFLNKVIKGNQKCNSKECEKCNYKFGCLYFRTINSILSSLSYLYWNISDKLKYTTLTEIEKQILLEMD